MSYARLAAYRAQLMQEVNRLVRAEQIRGPRQLGAKLKNLKLMAPQGEVGADPVLSEFVRTVLLAGNGTLLINNTFAEWATLQAVRRARPSLTLISLGIRNKVKPFSSLLIYSDQETASPVRPRWTRWARTSIWKCSWIRLHTAPWFMKIARIALAADRPL